MGELIDLEIAVGDCTNPIFVFDSSFKSKTLGAVFMTKFRSCWKIREIGTPALNVIDLDFLASLPRFFMADRS